MCLIQHEKEFKETIDWIEIAIDRIERIISRLKLKAESVYSLWTERNKNLVSEIQKVRDEIDLQGKAYDRYIKEANSVGLSEAYAKKVRDGTIDIEKITDARFKDRVDALNAKHELELKEANDKLEAVNKKLKITKRQRDFYAAGFATTVSGAVIIGVNKNM